MSSLVQSVPGTTTTTSLSLTLSSTGAGNSLVMVIGVSASPLQPTVSSVTLGGSSIGSQVVAAGSTSVDSQCTYLWYAQGIAGGQTALVINITSGNTGSVTAYAQEWSGITVADQNGASPNSTSGTTWTSGASGTTTQASEIAIGGVCAFNATGIGTITGPGGAWNNLTQTNSATGHVGLLTGWEALSSIGTATYSGSFAVTATYAAVVATFKQAANNPPPPPRLIAPGWRSPSKLAQLQPPPPAPPAAIIPGQVNLSGTGSFGATGQIFDFGSAALSGTGSLSAAGAAHGHGSAALSGTGSLRAYEENQFANLSGTGSLRAYEENQFAALSGTGSLTLHVTHGYAIGLSGFGFMFIPQVLGGLVNGIGGGGSPQAFPGSSQVAVAPPGSSSWQWLGTLGQVTALKYSFTIPGGCDKMSMTILAPAAYRTQLFNPGWQVKVTRGGHTVWTGKLDEPQASPSGWSLTAVGDGNRGQDFLAIYSSTWPTSQPDQSINNAISRGLPWINPGVGTPSGAWFGQAVDSGAQTVSALLNLICTRGGLTWYVNSQPGGPYAGPSLSVFPLPSTVNRLLVSTTPVSRTLGGDINTIFIRYQSSGDNSAAGTSATYAVTSVKNAQSVAMHGAIETFIDLSDVGTQTAGQAQAVGNSVLAIYQRASFAGPFTASYGQLMNAGGQPVDPGTDQAGTVCRLILTDFGYGGEVAPQFPITFLVGSYEWDDFAQVATITPYQSVDQSLTGLLSMENTVLKPVTVAST